MINPVLKREIKSLLRTPKFFIGISIYLLLLVVCVNMIVLNLQDSYYGMEPDSVLGVYYFILSFQVLVLVMVVPSISGGAISNERERQTLDLLLVTKMTPEKIIRGKIYSSLLTVALLMLVTLPVYGILFYYGGVPYWYVIVNALYCMVVAVVIASIAIYASARFKKTTTAMVFTYLSVFIYTCVIVVVIALVAVLINNDFAELMMGAICFFNPIVNFISLLDSQLGTSISWDMLESFDIDLKNSYIYLWHINLITSGLFVWFVNKLSVKAVDPLSK